MDRDPVSRRFHSGIPKRTQVSCHFVHFLLLLPRLLQKVLVKAGLMDAQARLGLQAIPCHLPLLLRLRPHLLTNLSLETYLRPLRLGTRNPLAMTTELVKLGALVLVE